ncbi:MAG: hypothetical protein QOD50_633 [Actinomycetota bacterium]|jgi:hypothetical protein|nr:hypothetical protein [Actinomycetota bacterium]
MIQSMTELSADQITFKRTSGLRANSLAALVMLILEFGLGVIVNLYAEIPKTDHGLTFITALIAAIVNGPISLAIHAILGTLLLITAAICIVRAARTRIANIVVFSIIGLIAILAAWGSGTGFIGTGDDGASLTMGLATAVAILSYTLVLFFVPPTRQDR